MHLSQTQNATVQDKIIKDESKNIYRCIKKYKKEYNYKLKA